MITSAEFRARVPPPDVDSLADPLARLVIGSIDNILRNDLDTLNRILAHPLNSFRTTRGAPLYIEAHHCCFGTRCRQAHPHEGPSRANLHVEVHYDHPDPDLRALSGTPVIIGRRVVKGVSATNSVLSICGYATASHLTERLPDMSDKNRLAIYAYTSALSAILARQGAPQCGLYL